MGQARSTENVPDLLVDLVYELLDAHDDTARLAQADGCQDAWQAHLDYLRSLQRVGREALARAANYG